MKRGRSTAPFLGALVALVVLGGLPVPGAEVAAAAELKLQTVPARDAMTVLRAVAGVRHLEIVDEHALATTDGAEAVAVATAVIEAIEHPSAVTAEIPTRALGDGSALASVLLDRASPSEVLTALRKLRIAHIAVLSQPAVVTLRDTPEKLMLALDAVRELESVRGRQRDA